MERSHNQPLRFVVFLGRTFLDFQFVMPEFFSGTSLGLYLYAILASVWALLLGISLLRNPVQIQTA